MFRLPTRKFSIAFTLLAIATIVTTGLASAGATTKTLSTNFTLVNLSSQTANASVSYYTTDGSAWAAGAAFSAATLAANGGQAIIAQYNDTTMTPGQGSAVVSSDQPLGAVVQILARTPQVATQGAYIGSSDTASLYYVPLAMRKVGGTTSSQIIIQNADTGSITVNIQLIKAAAGPGANYTKSSIPIAQGASYYYDLSDESSVNLADGWYGSAVVDAGAKKITVVSNLFAGTNQLQTFNAFPSSKLATTWYVPLFASRLGNKLSTPVAVQNLSASSFAIDALVMDCTPAAGTTGTAFTAKNKTAIGVNEAYYFNPVVDTTLPDGFYGSCKVTAPGNVVAFVQMRQPGQSENAAAYEAINSTGTNTTVIVPLAAKQLSVGFATAITIQNLSSSVAATVNMTYTPSSAYVAGGGSATPIVINNVSIPAGASIIRNLITTTSTDPMYEPTLPSGWYGTLMVKSTSAPIDGFVQLKTIGATSGDTLMAHGVFTLP